LCYSTIKGNKYTDIQLGVPLDTRHQVLIYHLYYNTDKIHIYLWYSSCSFHVQSYCAVRRSAILSCLHDTHHVLLMYKFVVQFSKEQYSPLIMIQFMKFSSIQSLYSTVNYALFTSYHDGRHEVLFFFFIKYGQDSPLFMIQIMQFSWNYSKTKGPSWSWSYGSWIYNYLRNQCLSLLMLRVRISIRARCTLCDKVCQWLATGRWFSPPIKNWPPRYNWTIVESGVKHHQTSNQAKLKINQN
jgi:hypothetical protein